MQVLSRSRLGLHLTLRERIADAIRDAIIRGGLQAGSHVSEPELARRFGISRTPVREALRQLDSEGFIAVVPRRGARVTIFHEKDVQDFYDLRALLEGYAARLAAPRISERDLTRLAHLNDQMERYHQAGDLQKIPKVHLAFHDLINHAAGNEQLHEVVRMLTNRYQRFTIQVALSGKNQEAFAQHRQIIEALQRRDPDEAERLVQENVMLGKELMIHEVMAESKLS